ncbi:GNAT family N-acetyltransferase [Martelella radicis]|uniref:Aminoglycoside 6'-N-acetyltransferase n=1 Tax=Martelella radicis TaxID=1397476 RepID=A0A7W6P991_9HYPH|nr:GNAT family N-acetyltransferase [Martelella radicis]MBB4121121.1 aminoglycoside 6'-N-acetyltransferase [Martelella radicis]
MPHDGTIGFRPLREGDLELMARWLRMPHVAMWWQRAERQVEQMRSHIDDPTVSPFVVLLDDVPFGYIQLCDLEGERENEPALADQPAGTFGIDQFIGPAGMIGKGLGTRLVSAMAERALNKDAKRVLVDPHPDNAAAIRAYEKAGFVRLGTFSMTSGPALLMARDP